MTTAVTTQGQLTAMLKTVGGGADREGVLVKVQRGTDSLGGIEAPATAWYTPATKDITIDLPTFEKMADIDQYELKRIIESGPRVLDQLSRAYRVSSSLTKDQIKTILQVSGLLVHESGHARWSTWGDRVGKVDPFVGNILMVFEEGRIEKRAVDNAAKWASHHPAFRIKQYLRAIGRLLLSDMDEFKSPWQVIHAWSLVYGRFMAGTLTREEFAPIDNALRSIIGDDIVNDLSDIYDEMLTVDTDRDLERLIELAESWAEILKENFPTVKGEGEGEGGSGEGYGCPVHRDPEEESEEGEGEGKSAEGGEGSDAPGGGSDDIDKDGERDPDKESDDAPDLERDGGHGLTSDGVAGFTKAIENLIKETAWEEANVDLSNPKQWVEKVYGTAKNYGTTNWSVRKPSPKEIAAANRLARHFETLAVPTIEPVRYKTAKPTGRLKTREAVRQSAERAQGRMTTAKPWVDKRRTHTLGRPVIVGIATDTSGSMAWAQEMVASAAFIIGTAGQRVSAKTAAVTFGSQVEAVLSPDEVPTEVRIRTANGGVEEFDKAMAALDGALHLSTAQGAKVLVVISDNQLVIPFEDQKREKWMKKFSDAGVAIVWVDRSTTTVPHAESAVIDIGAARTGAGIDPGALIGPITKAIDKAFKG